jgi:ABC-type dipeptide/oligopeptide/nickel transport system permease component
MSRMVLSRIAAAVPVLLVVFTTTFVLFRLAPGGPFQTGAKPAPAEVQAALDARYGLDAPAWQQYLRYGRASLTGEFGPSYSQRGRSVGSIISQALPVSLQLGGAAMVVSIVTGVPLGVIAARRRASIPDRTISTMTATLLAIPDFILVSVLVIVLGVYTKTLPTQGWEGLFSLRAIIPIVSLAVGPAALLARYTRASVLNISGDDFVVAARAQGLSARTLERRVLRNAIPPVMSIAGLVFSALVGGSFFVESAYNIPGLGRESVKAILARDYPLIMGTVLVFAVLVVAINLCVDVAAATIDKRLIDGGTR